MFDRKDFEEASVFLMLRKPTYKDPSLAFRMIIWRDRLSPNNVSKRHFESCLISALEMKKLIFEHFTSENELISWSENTFDKVASKYEINSNA